MRGTRIGNTVARSATATWAVPAQSAVTHGSTGRKTVDAGSDDQEYIEELADKVERLERENKLLHNLIDKTTEGLHEIASGGDPPPGARWWQRQCPFRWSGDDVWHAHNCRLVGNGNEHIHVCDCGATNR